jgi:hypothetical protein
MVCSCGMPAHCCQPAVAGGIIYADLRSELNTHLALWALFTQSSPVCIPLLQAFPFPSTLGDVTLHPLSQICMFVYSSLGKWVFPPSCGVFLPLPLSQAFLLLVAGCVPLLPLEPLWPTWIVYLPFQEGFPSPNLWHSEHPTLFPACLYFSYCLLFSFSFFPRWRSVCPGVYASLAQVCLWEYCGTTKLTLSTSSQAVWAWATGSPGALLVSPFNMMWRFSVLAGGVEGSKFCLFSMVLPARCVSSVSPRFYYRRHAFCFLPLAAILDSISSYIKKIKQRPLK